MSWAVLARGAAAPYAIDASPSWTHHVLFMASTAHDRVSALLEENRPYVADCAAAATAAVVAAPIISCIDRAICTNASGVMPFWPAMRESTAAAVRSPVSMLKGSPFRWLALVYASTYAAANIADTYSRRSRTDSRKAVLAASTTANATATIAKDRAFAQLFGASAARALPLPTYAIWGARDLLTMAFAFTIPPVVSAQLQDRLDVSPKTANVVATLGVPCVAQVVAAPLHLLGLNLYNAPTATLSTRIATVRSQAPITILAKSLRIFTAFSLAGLVNKELRASWGGDM